MGIPNKDVYDPDSDGWFAVVPVVNQVDAAIERAQEKNKQSEPGTRYQVFDARVHPEYQELLDQ